MSHFKNDKTDVIRTLFYYINRISLGILYAVYGKKKHFHADCLLLDKSFYYGWASFVGEYLPPLHRWHVSWNLIS